MLFRSEAYNGALDREQQSEALLARLKSTYGDQHVYITGLATDFCVAWTAMDARKAGFNVYVIEDATRAIDLKGSLAAAWKNMTAKGVKRIQSGDMA